MSWRVAAALIELRNEVNRRWPDREKKSDGSIGDSKHKAKKHGSDHNPWVIDAHGIGVVRAIDVDAGPGLDPNRAHDGIGDTVAEAARLAGLNGHPAMKGGGYVIYEGKIASANSHPPWSWRTFSGDSHVSHPHISVGTGPAAYDSKQGWDVATTIDPSNPGAVLAPAPVRHPGPPAHVAAPAGTSFPPLTIGSTGDHVKLVQRFLWGSSTAKTKPEYGKYEARTEKAVRAYQRMRGLHQSGVVDAATWAPIRKALHV